MHMYIKIVIVLCVLLKLLEYTAVSRVSKQVPLQIKIFRTDEQRCAIHGLFHGIASYRTLFFCSENSCS